MAEIKQILVPDIGDFDDIEIIEVLVAVGDEIDAESSLITLESDKAAMEIPSPFAGTVSELNVKVGDKISEGSLILSLSVATSDNPASQNSTDSIEPTTSQTTSNYQ